METVRGFDKGFCALVFAAMVWLVVPGAIVARADAMNAASQASEEEKYDRLDGMGASGKKVNVIEWEGNLEIHVYPAGSLSGLSLKLDKRQKNKPVMVIGYRFDGAKNTQLIRRAILGVPFQEGFRAYRDSKAAADGYDKVIISNNGLSGDLKLFALDAEPTQLYPDGHPALVAAPAPETDAKRKPAADTQDHDVVQVDDAGTIQPFFTKPGRK